ncbi:CDP-diacylglycerol--serine O-phosphatidyltransferase [Phreatobacter stygius]|uniref:CDP-diacylglycerol--serine O-phosphatidyltransferase n=1 Tax=Phreatobacter stygius TaxID=1940610 RepID=A0A4D7B4Q3_9HYPH|nr:CDP-diacylglycerol--serine O-phosphatidyltransferase [Phreatobacter stygius]QCI68789.1 CDP-diacylglycerol--serine O-phosphatidyltransferase [Phreatobacter stygius]
MSSLFQPFTPDRNEPPRRRFRPVPLRLLIPNLITLLALCAGLSAIRMALEGKIELAVYLILGAAVLDSVDGRIARLLKGTSKFGAELDSLADFVSFGAVPALVLYLWGMNEAGPIGWIAVLVFAICGALRLARFNVQIEDPNQPAWMANYFTGVPIPAGAVLVMLPIYLENVGVPKGLIHPWLVTAFTMAIALLMVSRVPVFSGKKLGAKVPRESVLPLFVAAIAFVALLMSYPWIVLAVGTVAYLASLPFGAAKAQALARAEPAPAATEPAEAAADEDKPQ